MKPRIPSQAQAILVRVALFVGVLAAFASLLLLLSPGPAPVTAASAIPDPYLDLSGATLATTQTTTTVDRTSGTNPSTYGQSLTFRATVKRNDTDGPVVSVGDVTFKDNGINISGCDPRPVDAQGQATCTTDKLAVGTHTITAVYSGAAVFEASTGTLSPDQVVNKADTTTTLTSSPNPSAFGETVTFTATVGFTGGITPAGTVTFKDGAAAIGTGPLHASGVATFTTCTLDVGIHTVTAEYGGDASFNGSTSAPLTHVVGEAEVRVTLESAPSPESVFGQTVTLTATVKSTLCAGLAVPPTGIVFFNLEDDTTLGVAALDATGVATFSTSVLAAGVHDVTAVYAGDDDYKAIESAPLTHTVNRLPDPDLQITKTDNPDPVYAGQELFYDITVINNADYTTASGVVVTDTLPAEVTYIADTASCTYTPGPPDKLVCTLDDIAPGASRSFQIKTAVAANAVAATSNGTIVITNTAEVTMTNGLADAIPANNTVAEGTFVEDSADLSVVKVSKPDELVQAGELFTYTIFVDNWGPSSARNVVVRDNILASGLFEFASLPTWQDRAGSCTYIPVIPGGETGPEQQIECRLSDPLEPLSFDTEAPFAGRAEIKIALRANETQDVNNLVQVFTDDDPETGLPGTPDPDISNNQAQDFISVLDAADLQITKTYAGTSTAGDWANYTLTVVNVGPSTAENVVVVDTLPLQVTVNSIVKPGGGSCATVQSAEGNQEVTCTLGDLPSGQSRDITLNGKIAYDAPKGWVWNEAKVYSENIFDPDNSNNVSSSSFWLSLNTEFEVYKLAEPNRVARGEVVEYRIELTNRGPSMAWNTVMNDEFYVNDRDSVEFLGFEIEGGDGDCFIENFDDTNVRCDLGDIPPLSTGHLPPQRVVYLTFRVHPDAEPSQNDLDNTVHVTGDAPVTYRGGSVRSEVVQLEWDAELAIEKTSEPQKVYAGEQKKYTIKVTNLGPSMARDVTVADSLPAGVTYETDDAGCTLSVGTGPAGVDQVFCALGAPGKLMPGDTWEFSIWVLVDAGVAPGTPLTNQACVAELLPNGGQEVWVCDTAENLVLAKADLRVFKDCKPDDPILEGEEAICTISVQNLGPSVATGVTFNDVYVSDGQFHFGILPGLCVHPASPLIYVKCDLPVPLPVGTTWYVDIPVIGDEPQNINDHVTASSAAEDPDESNNWAEDEVNVGPLADLSVSKTMTGEMQIALQQGLVFDIGDPNQPFPAVPNYGTLATDVTAGRRIQYEMVVRNDGPTPAENVLLSDRLPAGVTIYPGSLEISQGSCETGTPGEPLDRMTCGLGSILPGEGVTLTLEVLVDPSLPAGTVLENDVSVTSDTYDNDNSDNQANTQTVVQTWADTTITKLSVGEEVVGYDDDLGRHIVNQTAGRVTAGMELRYEISVQNNGASDAQNVQVLDLLPGQTDTGLPSDPVTFLRSDGADCQPFSEQQEIGIFGPGAGQGKFGQILWCDLGTVPVGARKTFHIYVQVDPAVPELTVLTNGAYVWWGPASPPAQPGAFLPFPFPQIPPELPTTDDPYLDNNFASTDTTVNVVAELAIEKASEPQKVYAGEQKKYTIKVTNLGPSVARGVTVIDYLPVGVTYETNNGGCQGTGPVACVLGDMMPGNMQEFSIWVLVDPGVAPGTELVNQACVQEDPPPIGGEAVCASAENLVLGKADLRITKFGKPDGEVRTGEVLTYTVVVDNLGPGNAWGVALKDILQTNGIFDLIDIVSDRVTSCTLLLPGNVVQGPFPLTADPWPPDASVPAPPGVNQPTGEGGIRERLQVDCTLVEDLDVLAADGPPNSGRWILTVRVRAFESQDMNNVADVVADTFDPDTDNNHAEVLHDVTEAVDLKVTKSAVGKVVEPGGAQAEKADEVTAGLSMTYTIEVENLGPMRAENVRLEDLLPVEVVVTGWKADQGWCLERDPDNPTEPMTCELGEIAAGQTVAVEIYVEVPSPVPCDSWLANSVRVYSDFFDPDEDNNVSDNLTWVNAMADLGVSKVQSPDIVLGGTPIDYRIDVWNQGPSDAPSVVIEDLFPEELMILSWECVPVGTGATCPEHDPDIRDLEYSFDLPAGTYVYFIVHGMRKPYPDWSFTNEVRVSTGGCVQDPVLSDNTASDVNEPYMHFLPIIGHIRFEWSLPDLKVKGLWAERLGLSVRIVNSGPEPVTGPFWVDAYIDPVSAPTAVGQQWNDLAEQGAVWYVQGDALPLEPGATLDLRNDDEHYVPHWSEIEWPISPGSRVYAQVDSRTGDYGMVYEKHEAANHLYNNIKGPVTSIR